MHHPREIEKFDHNKYRIENTFQNTYQLKAYQLKIKKANEIFEKGC